MFRIKLLVPFNAIDKMLGRLDTGYIHLLLLFIETKEPISYSRSLD